MNDLHFLFVDGEIHVKHSFDEDVEFQGKGWIFSDLVQWPDRSQGSAGEESQHDRVDLAEVPPLL